MREIGAGTKMILVVEGDPIISQVCRRVLTGEGFEVDIAINGAQAKEMISGKKYDLILINIKTPVINGIKLYKHILEKYPEIAGRVVFTNGEISGVDTQAFLRTCGRPFLPKPFSTNQLTTIIKEALEKVL